MHQLNGEVQASLNIGSMRGYDDAKFSDSFWITKAVGHHMDSSHSFIQQSISLTKSDILI